jgi:hypothetical protein
LRLWIAFLYLMTNKPSLGGAIATVVAAGAISVPLARLALRPRAAVPAVVAGVEAAGEGAGASL